MLSNVLYNLQELGAHVMPIFSNGENNNNCGASLDCQVRVLILSFCCWLFTLADHSSHFPTLHECDFLRFLMIQQEIYSPRDYHISLFAPQTVLSLALFVLFPLSANLIILYCYCYSYIYIYFYKAYTLIKSHFIKIKNFLIILHEKNNVLFVQSEI